MNNLCILSDMNYHNNPSRNRTISHRQLVARTISRQPISRGNGFAVAMRNEFRFVAKALPGLSRSD